MDLVWIDSTTVSLAPLGGSGVLKNKTLHWAGKKGLKHSRSMWASVKRFLCGACLSASNKLDMTVFNELWARGNWDAIVHVVPDKGYDCSSVRDLIKKQGKIPVIPRRQGAIRPGVSQIESAIKYATPSSDSYAHIKEHKRCTLR